MEDIFFSFNFFETLCDVFFLLDKAKRIVFEFVKSVDLGMFEIGFVESNFKLMKFRNQDYFSLHVSYI